MKPCIKTCGPFCPITSNKGKIGIFVFFIFEILARLILFYNYDLNWFEIKGYFLHVKPT